MQLPSDFISEMRALLAPDAAESLLSALASEPDRVTSIRVNAAKTTAYGIVSDAGVPVPWCGMGRYLDSRPQFTFDPFLHAGCYYVQEASSMFLGHALDRYLPCEPCVALDLCAAPGGKSTHLRSMLPDGSLLVSNEYVRQRSNILAENMCKWGHPGTIVTNNAPDDFASLASAFDVIVADVPCSGEGMFRKDSQAVDEWSKANVSMCSRRQRDIISDVWPALRDGGLMAYSTCTFNRHEDEENVAWIADTLGADVLPVDIPAEWGIAGNMIDADGIPVYRFLPGSVRGEGFFLALLRKHGVGQRAVPVCRKAARAAVPAPDMKKAMHAVTSWVRPDAGCELLALDDKIAAFPTPYIYMLYAMRQRGLRILHAGIPLATLRGRDVVPQHALAMSIAADLSAFGSCDVDYPQAVAYLQGLALTLPPTASRGYVVIRYRGVPLGFVKNLGNRANNLYPQEWRIRSGFVPETVPQVL